MKKLFRIAPDKHQSGGSGRSGVLFSWQPEGTFLATVGKNGIVHIWDRHGEKIQGGEIQLKGSGSVMAVEWDADGERVAVLQENNPIVEIWEYSTKQCVSLETNLKDPTFLKWAKAGHELAIGTAKGNLLIYNSQDRRKVRRLGEHGPSLPACFSARPTHPFCVFVTPNDDTVHNRQFLVYRCQCWGSTRGGSRAARGARRGSSRWGPRTAP